MERRHIAKLLAVGSALAVVVFARVAMAGPSSYPPRVVNPLAPPAGPTPPPITVVVSSGTISLVEPITVDQPTASELNAEVQGDAATDATVSGKPVLTGGRTDTAETSAPNVRTSAEGEAVSFAASRDGVQYVLPFSPQIFESSAEYTAQQTDTVIVAAPGAGLSNYITTVFFSCNGKVQITIEDDEGSDDVLFKHYCDGQGSGAAITLLTPMKQGANQQLLLTTSAVITVSVTVVGFIAP